MRVNARFEGVAEQQVAYLATSSGLKVSDVLRDSVDFYYRHVRAQTGQLKHLSRFIGQGDSGRSDISASVKEFIGEDLDAKLLPTPPDQVRCIPAMMQRYNSLPMDLADASLVLLAEHLGHGRILTTDERNFGNYRWKSRQPLDNLLAKQP